ncbi:MAG: hypothetical protein JNK38_27080 [Acidobacteria bacterium]|nr:hypothetical protein [Acidobacteriota bacterium]
MKLFILRHKILFSILSIPVLLIGLLVGYEFSGQPIGWLAAQLDQLRGVHRIKIIGMADVTDEHYAKSLDDNYGVKADRLAYCTPSIWEFAFHKGYNAVAVPAIKKQFGEDVFAQCHELAILTKLKEPDLDEEVRKMLESNLQSLRERNKKQ